LAGSATWSVSAGNTVTLSDTLGGGVDSQITGGFTKAGPGTLVLIGANSYTGGTSVLAGTLRVDGSILGNVTVSGGATLGGSGTVGGTVTVTGGRLSPGDSPGTLTVGSLALDSASSLDIELGSGAWDRVIVNGALARGGTLNVTLWNGFTPTAGQSFDILDWGSASGTFSSVVLPDLAPRLTWDTAALQSAGVIAVTVAPVPEPAAVLALSAVGLAAVWRFARRGSRSVAV
jgi:autotransporter-associated beta strand protein